MDEERRRGREYYQVTLDTGRIFWIAFLLGIIVIGIFIFGYYVGGDKLKKGLTTLGKSGLLSTERSPAETETTKLPPLNIFNRDLESETRFLDLEKPEKQPPLAIEETKDQVTEIKPFEPLEEEEIFEQVKRASPSIAKPPEKKYTYREAGDYYIQVASFTKKENADAMAEGLRKKLYKVVIEETTVDSRQFYRVQVGPFETKSIARNTMISMRNRYDLKDPFVLKKNS